MWNIQLQTGGVVETRSCDLCILLSEKNHCTLSPVAHAPVTLLHVWYSHWVGLWLKLSTKDTSSHGNIKSLQLKILTEIQDSHEHQRYLMTVMLPCKQQCWHKGYLLCPVTDVKTDLCLVYFQMTLLFPSQFTRGVSIFLCQDNISLNCFYVFILVLLQCSLLEASCSPLVLSVV